MVQRLVVPMPEMHANRKQPVLLEKKYLLPFLLVTILFFSWALAAQLNDILIRQFQKALELSRGQARIYPDRILFRLFLRGHPGRAGHEAFRLQERDIDWSGTVLRRSADVLSGGGSPGFWFLPGGALHHCFRVGVSGDCGESLRVGDGGSAHRPFQAEYRPVFLRYRRFCRAVPGQHLHLLGHRIYARRDRRAVPGRTRGLASRRGEDRTTTLSLVGRLCCRDCGVDLLFEVPADYRVRRGFD